jgi:small-conductance mechanosensitive channel
MWQKLGCALVVLVGAMCALAQANANVAAPPPQDIVEFLNQTIVWYRQLAGQQQLVREPSDVTFVNQSRELGDQVLRLSFDFARMQAKLLSARDSERQEQSARGAVPSQYHSLMQVAAKLDQRVKESQQELDSLRQRLDGASGRQRRILQSSIVEVQSELELQQARRDAMQNMISFVSGISVGNLGQKDLESQIAELARTVPVAELKGKQAEAQNSSSPAAAPAGRKEEPSGILALIGDLFALRRNIHTLEYSMRLTDELATASKIRTPLVTSLRDLVRRGDALTDQPASKDPAVLAEQKKQLDALTAEFKPLSAKMLPLGKQRILLDLYKQNLETWRSSIQAQYNAELKNLMLRLGTLAFILAVVVGISELLGRATVRYIHDVRRRYQFGLLRRIVMWSVVAVILAMTFASELGSLATFAGLMTAGVVVALQSVILSVVGYFLLIGKYGIRVGDRVQIAGITGDVVDIGVVRLHLMEVDTQHSGARATGRVVAFSNSIVFQANAGLFKQIPGTSFVWHEITLNLPASSEYRQLEEQIMAAVKRVCDNYRENMARQRRVMQRALSPMPISELEPESRLRLTPSGAELVIRYPVEMENAGEIDDHITREVLNVTEREPKLKLELPRSRAQDLS